MAKIAMPRLKSTQIKSSGISSQNQREQIQKLAYQFFVDRGYEHGHDAEDWLRAETIVKNAKS